jgi:acetyl-CoA acetyltransferase
MTPFAKQPERSAKALSAKAIADAFADAGGAAAEAVEAIYVGNALSASTTGQEMVLGQVLARHAGIGDVPVFNIENACASSSSALHLAWQAVASGSADAVLALGCEVMTAAPKEQVFRAIGTAVDVEEVYAEGQPPVGRSFFMDHYAALARSYMERAGIEATTFAEIAAKNFRHGAGNPRAQYGRDVTAAEVLASRPVVDPLTLLMCSPLSDGAAAAIIAGEDQLDRFGGTPVEILGSVVLSGSSDPATTGNAIARASRRAFERAGVGPDDLDLLEVHDATAPAELFVYEDVGLAAPGEGARLVAEGATALGGRVPVNVSGGLVARGHPIGATGLGQVFEAVEQLRGRAGDRQVDGARLALTQNAGGWIGEDNAAVAVHLFGRA